MASVSLEGLTLFAKVGVSEAERKAGIELELDIKVSFVLDFSVFAGEIESTVDYAALADIARQEAQNEHLLLEGFATAVVKSLLLLKGPPVGQIWLRVCKLRPWVNAQAGKACLEVSYPGDF